MQELAGGEQAGSLIDIYPTVVNPKEIAFAFDNCDMLIGKKIDHNIIKKIIRALGISILSEGSDALLLAVPAYKVDVTRPADVVEEVLRIYGYNNIGFPARLHSSLSFSVHPNAEKLMECCSDLLSANGFQEILNNSLTKSSYYDLLKMEPALNIAILNPLSSDLGIMRRSLLFGGLETISYNQKRKSPDLRLYETGKVYLKKKNEDGKWPYIELQRFGIFMTGRLNRESWNSPSDKIGFFDLKGSVEQILNRLGLSAIKMDAIEAAEFSSAMKGVVRKKEVVRFGLVSKSILKALDVSGEVYYADFDWDAVLSLVATSKEIRFSEVPKFPSVRRDLALVLDKNISYNQVEELAWQTEKTLLREVNLFDVYEGEKLGANKKSYAVSFILQDIEATLTDVRIEKIMEKLTKTYTDKLGATIRI